MTELDEINMVRCKNLVLVQLDAMESILKSLKEMNRLAEIGLDTSSMELAIVDIYEGIEEHKPKDD